MIEITSAQLDALLLTWAYPGARILGLIAAAPVFNNLAVPVRIRLVLGLAITAAVAPTLQLPVGFQPGTYLGLLVLAQQMLIGIGLGLAMRMVFTAVDVAGEVIGMQMGLSFATFYDPQNAAQTAVLSEFLGLLTSLIFLAMNGHLLMIDVLVRSFELLPVSTQPLNAEGWLALGRAGGIIFGAGLLLALPLVSALLITNIALGVLTRSAPQLNLFAIGFPITCTIGFVVLMFGLDAFAPVMAHFFDRGFDLMDMALRGWSR
ncbi:MAG: flagellar biosynthetic protein FliR [Moraxellaceae bacterium]|nr:flagellar biosynthetic protein FliR [Moraxellaceae bacterium]